MISFESFAVQFKTMREITLISGRQKSILRKHPWIFSGAIKQGAQPKDGELVKVSDSKGNYLCTGMWQNGSIAIRVISFEEVEIDEAFWEGKFSNALALRKKLQLIDNQSTNCFRLIHAEGDGLPGLIVDIYGKIAVVQCHSIGMYVSREVIATALKNVMGDQINSIYTKSKSTLPKRYSQGVEDGFLLGAAEDSVVLENGHQFYINFQEGQKTGFFLDQRNNRQLLTQYAKGKKVLNAFCYSGGFSVYALAAGAAEVHSVDVSKKAIEWTDKNVALNPEFKGKHTSEAADVMDYLKNDITEFGVMVVDPPAFAKSFGKRHNAVQGYKRLNAMAIKKIAPGGILFTFSCSHVVDKLLFQNTIAAAAMEVGRNVRVLHHLSQPADHPVSLFHPEGAYLKGLVLEVD